MTGGTDLPCSLHTVREIVFAALRTAEAGTVLRIGDEDAPFAADLAAWAGARGVTVTCELGPVPDTGFPARDAYLIDGDRNHWTVSRSLAAIHRGAGAGARTPLVIVHHVAWPWARRDSYRDPAAIPADALRPHRWDRGVLPGSAELVPGGLCNDPRSARAESEGGAGNGVLTAVEDFLGEHPGHRLVRVPLACGLGFLFPDTAPFADELSARLSAFQDDPVLARVERERIAGLVRVEELREESARRVAAHDAVAADRARLLARLSECGERGDRAEAALAGVREEAVRLASSRMVRIASGVQAPLQRRRPGLGTLRERLLRIAST